jgi:hypothetical protein
MSLSARSLKSIVRTIRRNRLWKICRPLSNQEQEEESTSAAPRFFLFQASYRDPTSIGGNFPFA